MGLDLCSDVWGLGLFSADRRKTTTDREHDAFYIEKTALVQTTLIYFMK